MDGINEPNRPAKAMSARAQARALSAIAAGANPNLPIIRNGPRALCCAVAMGADQVARALIDKGASLEDRVRPYESISDLGYTALGLAATKRMGALSAALCEAGADPMAMIPTFNDAVNSRAPILWSLIFYGLGDAIEAGRGKIDWSQKAPGPGDKRRVRVSYFTLAAALSSESLRALVRSGAAIPASFETELASLQFNRDSIESLLAAFVGAEREALERGVEKPERSGARLERRARL